MHSKCVSYESAVSLQSNDFIRPRKISGYSVCSLGHNLIFKVAQSCACQRQTRSDEIVFAIDFSGNRENYFSPNLGC